MKQNGFIAGHLDEVDKDLCEEMSNRRDYLSNKHQGTPTPTISELEQIAKNTLMDLYDNQGDPEANDITYISTRMHAATEELDRHKLRLYKHQVCTAS